MKSELAQSLWRYLRRVAFVMCAAVAVPAVFAATDVAYEAAPLEHCQQDQSPSPQLLICGDLDAPVAHVCDYQPDLEVPRMTAVLVRPTSAATRFRAGVPAGDRPVFLRTARLRI